MNLSLCKVIGIFFLGFFNNPLFAEDFDQISPFGKMVDIDGYQLHINCEGEGRPIVIFDSGLGGFSMDWLKVQNQLKDVSTICTYDRAGYGWSDEGPSPRVTEQIVEELHELLINAALEPPYVLVGHSFGGFNVQYFSKLYPKLVAGMVLVESSHPEQFSRLPDIPLQAAKNNSRQRLTTMFDARILRNYPEPHRIQAGQFLTSDKSIRTQQREFLNFTQSGVQVGQVNRQLDVPLVIVTRAKRVWPNTPYGDQQETVWKQLQKELLDLSTDSVQMIAENSGHLVYAEQPELVANAVASVIDKVCLDYPNYTATDETTVAMCDKH